MISVVVPPQARRFAALLALTCALSPLVARASTPASTVASASGEVVATAQRQPAQPAVAATPIQTTTPQDAPDRSGKPVDGEDRRVHGYIEVGVGTGGYREVAGAVEAPVGGGHVSIAVDQGQAAYGRR